MNDRIHDRFAEQPRSEPEILPPELSGPARGRSGRPVRDDMFVFVDEGLGTQYRTFKLPSPLTVWLIMIVIGLVAGAVLMLALGFVLFLVPIAAVAVAALILSGQIRAWWSRLDGSRAPTNRP